jgi:hypothetical protein
MPHPDTQIFHLSDSVAGKMGLHQTDNISLVDQRDFLLWFIVQDSLRKK